MPLYYAYAHARLNQNASVSVAARNICLSMGIPLTSNTGSTRQASVYATIARQVPLVDRIAAIRTNLDEDEPPPEQSEIDAILAVIRDAETIMGHIPDGRVTAFFGEVNVSWQEGDDIVRVASFPNRPAIIQTGKLSLAGSYRSEQNPTGTVLAEKLKSLVAESQETELTISG